MFKLNRFMQLLVVITLVMTSAVRTTTVYADDGGTESVPEESAAPPGEEGTSTEAESAPAAESPQDEQEAAESAVEKDPQEPVTVAEFLEQLPEDTALVVVNEAGEVEPLATAEAAEIIATGDPIWCSATAPIIGAGEAGCTGSHVTFQDLIATLAAYPALYNGDGTIWVESSYAGNDDVQINLDGTSLSGLRSSNLTIQGGWTGGTTVSGRSTADVSMIVTNWTGNIAIRNFDINSEDNAGFGLRVLTQGSITLSDVSVIDTELNTSGFGDGAELTSTGNGAVSITNGDFNQNAGNGLLIDTGGAIALTDVTANQNRLTGASLDSGGAVSIGGGSQFNQNGSNTASHGLVVHAGGGITMNNVEASSNALRGASLTAGQNVLVGASTFSGNLHATGLFVRSGGSVTLNDVYSFSNNMGADLRTTGVGGIEITDSGFGVNAAGASLGNSATGLHAESGGAITLNNVAASNNQNNGAYLLAEGNITVNDGAFSGNVQSCSPADPGIFAWSNGGDIALTSVVANDNDCGSGAVLKTSGAGTVTVTGGEYNTNGANGVEARSGDGGITFTGGQYNTNGDFGISAHSGNGNITLANVIASFNGVKGAYLNTGGTGNIFINNSSLIENGSYGIYASASEGDINLDLVTVTGNNVTDYGAVLNTGSGTVYVSDSAFNSNTKVGLQITSSKTVYLSNVTADGNGGNGVEVYTITTANPICQGGQPVSITVEVSGGTFTNNDEYGLLVKPGPTGTLTFVNPADFGTVGGANANDLGDFLIDLSQGFKDCTPKPEDKPGDKPDDSKEPNTVEIPANGGAPVEQDCENSSGTILKLPNGTWMKVGCPYEGFSNLKEVLEQDLPSPLGAGVDFSAAIEVSLQDGEGNSILNEDGTVTINFLIPEGSEASDFSILFWDPTLNDGAGGWVELPPYEVGTSFALNPDDPDDARTIISGVKRVGNLVTVTVNFPGVFMLVEN